MGFREGGQKYPHNLANREEGLLLVTYSLYCSQAKQKTTCALLSALCPCPPGLLVR